MDSRTMLELAAAAGMIGGYAAGISEVGITRRNPLTMQGEKWAKKLKPCRSAEVTAYIEQTGNRRQSAIYECESCGCELTGEEFMRKTVE